ncbi:adaptor protein MecA [Butyrivibrio proteoclasticus]|uniref:adaptor protein MecA n=1 Tax=Butyrivibrio proteoclasticus TaxID=43305 RepID=UPI00047EBFF3|nr:adaptor protein MecA [Butyrivibrio proteoclasticus]
MEFKRINKDTVTCIITEDDMDEQGIKLEDLFEKKKEAMDFLHDVMRKAEEEVDYKPTGSFMPMQITVLPDHSISLTLSENASASFGEILKNLTDKAGIKIPKNVLEDLGDSVDEERINRLNDYLKSLKQFTNSVKNIMEDNDLNKSGETISVNQNATVESSKEKANKIASGASINAALSPEEKKKRDENRLKFHEYVFTFNDIRTVITFCKKAPLNLNIVSSLYKNDADGMYYLDLMRSDEDPKRFAALFTMAYEFGHFQATNQHVIAHIKENYECIVKDNAISQLAQVVA